MDWGREECENGQADSHRMGGASVADVPLQSQESVLDPIGSWKSSFTEVASGIELAAALPISPVCIAVCFCCLSPAVLAATRSGSWSGRGRVLPGDLPSRIL